VKLTIGDANNEAAFLTDQDGYDKAVVNRYTEFSELPPEHTAALLTDEQWGQFIILINAAPDLLAALDRISELLSHDELLYSDILKISRAAIASAKGGAK
jgi:hypothetical protein